MNQPDNRPDQPKPHAPKSYLMEDAKKNYQAYVMQKEQERTETRWEKIIRELEELKERF